LFPPDRTDWALRHAKRVATRSTCGRDQEMFVTQAVAEKPRNPVMRLSAGANAGITACAILEIDQQKVLRFEQSLIQKIVEMQSGRNRFLLIGGHPRSGDRFDLLANCGKSFQHQREIRGWNLDDVDP